MDAPPGPARESHRTSGGRIPGTGGAPAYELSLPDPPPVPVLIAVPHAGRNYPEDLLRRLRHPQEATLRLEDRLVDLVASALARTTGAALIRANAPRAMIDLNRSPDDMDLGMVADPERLTGAAAQRGGGPAAAGRRARGGLGLVPRRLPGLGELWRTRLTAADLEARIAGVHQPYHRALGETLERLRDRWGAALLIDLHSMPPLGPKAGPDAAADFVLGDRFGASCAPGMTAVAIDHLARAGWRAAHNRPYAGGYVLDRHAAPMRAVHAMQLEVCRTTYLDDALRSAGEGLQGVVTVLTGLVRRLAADLTQGNGLAEAAE